MSTAPPAEIQKKDYIIKFRATFELSATSEAGIRTELKAAPQFASIENLKKEYYRASELFDLPKYSNKAKAIEKLASIVAEWMIGVVTLNRNRNIY